jgi:hypothetical protein
VLVNCLPIIVNFLLFEYRDRYCLSQYTVVYWTGTGWSVLQKGITCSADGSTGCAHTRKSASCNFSHNRQQHSTSLCHWSYALLSADAPSGSYKKNLQRRKYMKYCTIPRLDPNRAMYGKITIFPTP